MYIKICKHCNEEIICEKQQQFASHVSCCKSNPRERIYKTKERFNYNVNCEKCKNEYVVNLTEYNFIKNNCLKLNFIITHYYSTILILIKDLTSIHIYTNKVNTPSYKLTNINHNFKL